MPDAIREALTAAYEAADAAPPAETPPTPSLPVEPPAQPVTEETPPATDASASSEEATAAKPEEKPAAETPPAAPTDEFKNAPASWKPEERAGWDKLPKETRAAVYRREQEINRVLQHSSDARRRVAALDKVTEQYRPLMERYQVSLEQVVPPLLATRAALEVGTPAQKAQLVANICADFDIDLQQLDEALSTRYNGGRPQPVYSQQPATFDPRAIPALAPLVAAAEQIAEAQRAKAQEALAEVQAQPHYEEVRFTMADLMEAASAKGKDLPVARAYDVACQLLGYEPATPPTAATPSGTPPSVSEAAAILARSRKAAASIPGGAPRPTPPRKPGEGSVADEIRANFDAVGR